MKKPIRIIMILVAVAAIAGIWRYAVREKKGAESALTIYGSVDIRDASLAFSEQERIAAVLVEEGEKVASGQVLARLKTERIEAQIREIEAQIAAQEEVVKKLEAGSRPQEIELARADVAAAQATLSNSVQSFDRLQKTSGTGATSQQALDDALSRLDVAKAQLKARGTALSLALEGARKEDIAAAKKALDALKASLSFQKVRLVDMVLTAPSAGVVQSRLLEPGEMAGPAKPVLTLALTDPKWIRGYVQEPDLGRIKLGMKAYVTSDSYPGAPLEGWVGFISPTAEFTPKTVQTEELRTKLVYEARVFVRDPEDRLRLGQPVTVTLDGSMSQLSDGNAPAALPSAGK